MTDVDRTCSAEVHLGGDEPGPACPHLVIAWSADQPELAGHTAAVPRRSLLGRGRSDDDDPAPRLGFCAERPGRSTHGPNLAGAQLSRRQLLLEPTEDGALHVRSLGRHPLFLNGEPVTEGLARPGDTLRILHSLVLLVAARPAWEVANLPTAAPPTFPFGTPDPHGIVGESLPVWKLREAIRFAAQARQHVLVQGESGSGKELAARALHALSARRTGPFITRNAATLPEGLVDAELFGSVKGYPHATSPEREGLIGKAERGTLFLDEIAEVAHELQAHLLRVLDEGGDYQRLGETRSRRADVRLVAATNRATDAMKHDFAARFRLRVVVPGLNERREDIPLLLRQLFVRAVQEHAGLAEVYGRGQRDAVQLSRALDPLLVEGLLRHRYTHHLRELDRLLWLALSGSPAGRVELTREVRGVLEEGRAREGAGGEAAVAGTGAVAGTAMAGTAVAGVAGTVVAAGTAVAGAAGTGVAATPPRMVQREAIEAALAQTGGNVVRAARLLGLGNRHVLNRLMEKHGIRRAAGQGGEPDE